MIRRTFLGSLSSLLLPWRSRAAAAAPGELPAITNWDGANDRVFLGGEVWANPMEDWHLADGWAECINEAAGRSIHSLTHQIVDPGAGFEISATMLLADAAPRNDLGSGLSIGIRSELDEVKSLSLIHI